MLNIGFVVLGYTVDHVMPEIMTCIWLRKSLVVGSSNLVQFLIHQNWRVSIDALSWLSPKVLTIIYFSSKCSPLQSHLLIWNSISIFIFNCVMGTQGCCVFWPAARSRKLVKTRCKQLKKVFRPTFRCAQHPKAGRNTQNQVACLKTIKTKIVAYPHSLLTLSLFRSNIGISLSLAASYSTCQSLLLLCLSWEKVEFRTRKSLP